MRRGPAAENRHGEAPRGAVPLATGRRVLLTRLSRLASVMEDQCAPLGASPPLEGVGTRKGSIIRALHARRKRKGCCSRWREQGNERGRKWVKRKGPGPTGARVALHLQGGQNRSP